MSALQNLINSIGHFFGALFRTTKTAFEQLPEDQQANIIKGVNLSQLIKEGYAKGEDLLIDEVSAKIGVPKDVAKGLILHVLQSLGIDCISVQDGLNELSGRIERTITDDGWNGLWESVAKFAASWLSTGKLNWVTLGLGVEFCYQRFLKGVE